MARKHRPGKGEGAAEGDPASMAELREAAGAIMEQNRHLRARSACRDFNPVTELDCTANGAVIHIRRLFEAVARFEEGRVPAQPVRALFRTTNALVNALMLRKGAPVAELEAVGVAFRECYSFWSDSHSPPNMPRDVYLKQLFAGRDAAFDALKRLHAAYVDAAVRKGRKHKALSAADTMDRDEDLEGRRRILAEIGRLCKGGMSAPAAVRNMMHGSYASRMRGVKAATWVRYYREWCSGKERPAVPPFLADTETMTETACVNEDRNGDDEDRNEDRNGGDEDRNEDKTGLVRMALLRNPRHTVRQLAKELPISKATVERALRKLKESGAIRRVGPNKGGWWEVLA